MQALFRKSSETECRVAEIVCKLNFYMGQSPLISINTQDICTELIQVTVSTKVFIFKEQNRENTNLVLSIEHANMFASIFIFLVLSYFKVLSYVLRKYGRKKYLSRVIQHKVLHAMKKNKVVMSQMPATIQSMASTGVYIYPFLAYIPMILQ